MTTNDFVLVLVILLIQQLLRYGLAQLLATFDQSGQKPATVRSAATEQKTSNKLACKSLGIYVFCWHSACLTATKPLNLFPTDVVFCTVDGTEKLNRN